MPKRANWQKMAAAVRQRRGELGLTQDEVVGRMNPPIGIQTYRRVEAGDQPNYRPTTLAAVASALDWPPDMLMRIATGAGTPSAVAMAELHARVAAVEEQLAHLASLEAKLDEIRHLLGRRRDGSDDATASAPRRR